MEKNILVEKRSDKETFQHFIAKCLKKLEIFSSNIKVPILKENIKYFVYNDKQISVEKGNDKFYKFTIEDLPKSFILKYGCELETCFVLNCSNKEFDDFIKGKITALKDSSEKSVKFSIWENLILFHIQKNIIPKLSKKFLKVFPYAYIMSYHSDTAKCINLSTGEEIFENTKVDNYRSLQFAQDASLKCGDTTKEDESLTVHCEIISPILNDLSEIKLLYDNLISQPCNISNYSTAFHVNVSINEIVDEKTQKTKQINFSDPMLFEICKNWYSFEKENYVKYRGDTLDPYANNIYRISDDVDYMKIIYEKISGDPITKEDVLIPENDYGLRTLFYKDEIYNKYRTLHFKKKFELLEFRIFPATNNTDELIEYTKISLNFIEKNIDFFLKNINFVASEYNRVYSLYKPSKYYNFDYILDYSGSFTNYKKLAYIKKDYDIEKWLNEKIQTEIVKEEEQTTTFLFFFKETHKIKVKETVTGMIPGENHYITNSVSSNPNRHLYIKYLPDEDFIQVIPDF